MTRAVLAAILLLAPRPTLADRLEAQPGQIFIAVGLRTAGGEISMVSRSLEWSFSRLDDRRVEAHARVLLSWLDSGHPAWDARIREAAGEAGHPAVEIDGVIAEGRFEGSLTARGVRRPLSAPVSAHRARLQFVVQSAFEVDLREFGIQLAEVAPRASVEFVGCFSIAEGAVFAGGIRHGS